MIYANPPYSHPESEPKSKPKMDYIMDYINNQKKLYYLELYYKKNKKINNDIIKYIYLFLDLSSFNFEYRIYYNIKYCNIMKNINLEIKKYPKNKFITYFIENLRLKIKEYPENKFIKILRLRLRELPNDFLIEMAKKY
jgi:hypothetical protein